VLIEDKVWPRPLGHGGAKLVIERRDGAQVNLESWIN
jgi:hypothetical protein